MNKRIWEFALVMVAVALVVAFFWRPAPETVVSAPTPQRKTPAPVNQTPPQNTVAYTYAAKEDFKSAQGLEGWEETLHTPIPEPSAERLKRGATLFQAYCALCHGKIGKGDGDAGQSLDPPPTNLALTGSYRYGHMELGVFRSSKYGVEDTGMAPWDGILTDDELWSITYYVRFLQED